MNKQFNITGMSCSACSAAVERSVKKLQVNMANIRKKFGDKPGEQNYIANELGVGYRLNP